MQCRVPREAGAPVAGEPVIYDSGRQRREKERTVEIPPPKPPRLGRQPVSPLKSSASQGGRTPADVPGVKIKRRADSDHRGRLDFAQVVRHPFFLFRRSEPDPHDVGARFIDLSNQSRVLFLADPAEWRRTIAGYAEPGITRAELGSQLFRDTLAAAIEIMA